MSSCAHSAAGRSREFKSPVDAFTSNSNVPPRTSGVLVGDANEDARCCLIVFHNIPVAATLGRAFERLLRSCVDGFVAVALSSVLPQRALNQ